MKTLLQIDFSQSQIIQEYIYGAVIIMLLAGIIALWLAYQKCQKENKILLDKLLIVLGQNTEVIRNNTELFNQIKGLLK